MIYDEKKILQVRESLDCACANFAASTTPGFGFCAFLPDAALILMLQYEPVSTVVKLFTSIRSHSPAMFYNNDCSLLEKSIDGCT